MNCFKKSASSRMALSKARSLLLSVFAIAAVGGSPVMAADGSCAADYSKQFPASANQFLATGEYVSYYTRPGMNGKSFLIGTWDKGSEPGFPVPYTAGGTTYMLGASQVNVANWTGAKAYPTAYRGNFTTSSKVDVWTIPEGASSVWWTRTSARNYPYPAPAYSGSYSLGSAGYPQAELDAGLYPGTWPVSEMLADTQSRPPNFQSYNVPVHPDPQAYALRYVMKTVYSPSLKDFGYSYSPDINVPDANVLAAATANAAKLTPQTISRLRGYIASGSVDRNFLDLNAGVVLDNDGQTFNGSNFQRIDNGTVPAGCGLFAEIVKHPRLQNVYMLKYFIRTVRLTGLAPFNLFQDTGTFIAYAPYLIPPPYVAPTIRADAVTTRWDQPVAIQPLGNDTAGSVALSLKSVSSPAHGTVSKSGSTVTYTPEAGWVGTVTMTYVATDGTTDGSAAITVTVVAPPPPPNVPPILNPDAVTTNHNFSVALNVLENDSDPDNGPKPMTVTNVTQPTSGSVFWAANGSVVYNPSGYTGTVTMTYTATDGSVSATSTITVTSEACYEDVWHDMNLSCQGGQGQGSADFQQGCTYTGPGYDTVEVLCPAK